MISSLIYLFIILIATLIGLVNFKKINNTFKLLTLLLLLTFISETISTILQYAIENNSLPQKIYTPLHIAFFSSIYYTLIKRHILKKLIAFFGALLFITAVIAIVNLNKSELPAYIITADSMMLVFFAILYFYELITNPVENNLLLSGSFWLNTSVIIYFTGSFVYWTTFSFLLNHYKSILIQETWIIDNFLDPFHYFLLGVALLVHIKKGK